MRQRGIWIAACLVILATALAGAWMVVARLFELPAPAGPFPVGTTTLAVPLPSTLVPLFAKPAVELWYPAHPSTDRAPYGHANTGSRSLRWLVRTHASRGASVAGTTERFPILFYVAGWQGRRTDNTVLAEELASQGYVVIGIDDVAINMPQDPDLIAGLDFSSRTAFEQTLARGARRVDLQARLAAAVLDAFVGIDRLDPHGKFTQRLDLSRVGIFGFSAGGAAAAETCRQDRRFLAALNLDGWLFGAVSKEGFDQPYLLANTLDTRTSAAATDVSDPGTLLSGELDREDERNQQAILERVRGFRLVVSGTSHMDFSDQPFFSLQRRLSRAAGDDPAVISRLLAKYVVAFFDATLNANPLVPPLLGPSPDPRAALTHFP